MVDNMPAETQSCNKCDTAIVRQQSPATMLHITSAPVHSIPSLPLSKSLSPDLSHDLQTMLTTSSSRRLVRHLTERGMDDAEGCSTDAPPLRP